MYAQHGFYTATKKLSVSIQELMILLQQLLSVLFEALDIVRAEEEGRRGAVLLMSKGFWRMGSA